GRRDFDRIERFAHVVRANDPRTSQYACGRDRQRARQSLVDPTAEQILEHRFARGADEHRQAMNAERGDRGKKREIMLKSLPETDTWINNQAIELKACLEAGTDPVVQEVADLRYDIVVSRLDLHRPRL